MSRTTVVRQINAPLDIVFNAISDVRQFAQAVPHITKIEFLTEQRTGLGTRFRETRLMRGREASTELEITEYLENQQVRMVSDAGGTVWDTLFSVNAQSGHTELTLVMDAKAYKLLAKLMNPLIKGVVKKAIESDLDAIKTYCENKVE